MRFRVAWSQCAVQPPSTGTVAPVTKLDLSEQGQITASAISLGVASRASGCSAILAAITFAGRSA